jgi:hypothetical protein
MSGAGTLGIADYMHCEPRLRSIARPRLTPTPKALEKALKESAQKAHRLADAFVRPVHDEQPPTRRLPASG